MPETPPILSFSPSSLAFGCCGVLTWLLAPATCSSSCWADAQRQMSYAGGALPGVFAFFSPARHCPAFHSLSWVPGYFSPLQLHKAKPSLVCYRSLGSSLLLAHLSHRNIVAIEIYMKASLILKQSLQAVRASQLRGLYFQKKKKKLAFESKSPWFYINLEN